MVGNRKHWHSLLPSLSTIMREFRAIINIINSNQWRTARAHHFRRGRGGRRGLAPCPAPGSFSLFPDTGSSFGSRQSREMAAWLMHFPKITSPEVLRALGVGFLLRSPGRRAEKGQGCSHRAEPGPCPASGIPARTPGCPWGFTHPEGHVLPGTCADDPGILVVAAVVDAPAEAVAGGQEGLAAVAVHVVQEDPSCSIAKIGVALVIQGLPAAQLLADHAGVAQAPVVVADGAPVAPVENLHPALAGVGAAHQADAAVT